MTNQRPCELEIAWEGSFPCTEVSKLEGTGEGAAVRHHAPQIQKHPGSLPSPATISNPPNQHTRRPGAPVPRYCR